MQPSRRTRVQTEIDGAGLPTLGDASELAPCVICLRCGVVTLTPVETICHEPARELTCCARHREAVNALVLNGVAVVMERQRAAKAA